MRKIKTVEDAKKYRYGESAGNPEGFPYNPNKCVVEIYDGYHPRQCARANGYGPENLYCIQHSRMYFPESLISGNSDSVFIVDVSEVAGVHIGEGMVVQETQKLLFVTDYQTLYGHYLYVPERVHKEKYNIFWDVENAVVWAIGRLEQLQNSWLNLLSKAQQQVDELSELLPENPNIPF